MSAETANVTAKEAKTAYKIGAPPNLLSKSTAYSMPNQAEKKTAICKTNHHIGGVSGRREISKAAVIIQGTALAAMALIAWISIK